MAELMQYGPIQDVHADGVDHLEIVGANFRIVYFKWQRVGQTWRRVIADAAIILPTAEAVQRGWPPETWGVPVLEMRPFRPKLVG